MHEETVLPLRDIPKFPLADTPTPLQRLERLTAHLGGPRILMKRDDMTGLAFGGNKTRKLEYLVGAALRLGADTLLTAGAAQSNHCRQTAAAAAKAGLRCHLVLGGEPPSVRKGNLLLDGLLGAEIHWAGAERRGETLGSVAESLRLQGLKPYLIPYGGSSALGAVGYCMAMAELARQIPLLENRVAAMVFASSSGGTHAGLITGARACGYRGRIIGVCVEKGDLLRGELSSNIRSAAHGSAEILGLTAPAGEDAPVDLDPRYEGEGYGVIGPREREALRLLARLEGILLDPVYTARAMGGLIDMIARGEFRKGESVLFWHTGGSPSLFAFAEEIG
ncbi:MAG TPA: D-cysteine desulfhydrase family protein [Bacteroidota bacterium]|nr:D-cysteine desulfhydrase family protein [Bacteroidota bacterium]